MLRPPLNHTPPQLEVLDLRHFPAAQLRPLLQDEAGRWQRDLHWDYEDAITMLLDYLESRVLPGFVALHDGIPAGYTFAVLEATKAVIGDVHAFGEGGVAPSPICETLLHHQIETLQNTPGLDRIESQLLLFRSGTLDSPFLSRGFRNFRRLFMSCALSAAGPSQERRVATGLRLLPWTEDCFAPAGELIHRAYRNHVDAGLNEQYRSVEGSLRFLHNIVRFPGCGVFQPTNSWVLRDEHSGALRGLLLSSQVRADTGHITQLCIAPELRGQGLGLALLRRALSEFGRRGLAAVSLTVTEANRDAVRLYEQAGFITKTTFDAMVWESEDGRP